VFAQPSRRELPAERVARSVVFRDTLIVSQSVRRTWSDQRRDESGVVIAFLALCLPNEVLPILQN
jgi:hypothetical protein